MGAFSGIGIGPGSLSSPNSVKLIVTGPCVESTTWYGMPMIEPAKSPEPKSACRPIDGPMKLISAAEFGSSGADEMSWFHRLSAGNATNPPRLPSWPGCMALHATGGGGGGLPPLCEVTCKSTAPEVLLPGFGLTTVISYIPGVACVPEAPSCVADTNVVVSAAPASSTWAPLTKSLPVMVT